VHPIERLRHVARAEDVDADHVVRAAVESLAGFSTDPVALLPAVRRLTERHPANGALWSLSARVVTASDPGDEAWRCLDLMVSDRTVTELGHAMPQGATVVVAGGPHRFTPALVARGDVAVTIVEAGDESWPFERRLAGLDVNVESVAAEQAGPVVASADLVLVDAWAVGPSTMATAPGSWPVAAVAHAAGVPVWGVAGWGRILHPSTWAGATRHVTIGSSVEEMPLALVDRLVGCGGVEPVEEGLRRLDAPPAPELVR
jgi:hypothetical protein